MSTRTLQIGQYQIDLDGLEARSRDDVRPITALEARLLRYLADREGQVVSQRELLTEVWDYHANVSSRAPYHAIARLRRWLEPDPAKAIYLQTARGVGFRLVTSHRAIAQPEMAPRRVLPRPRTRFFGRAVEVERLRTELLDERRPVATVVGVGGVGKTRLVVQVAHGVADAFDLACFCDLTQARDVVEVEQAVCRAIGMIGDPRGVDGIADALQARGRSLLVLDNVEAAIEPIAAVASELLDRCVDLQILATGREPLWIRGEAQVPMGMLEVPSTSELAVLAANPAVCLFVDRVQAQRPSFRLRPETADGVASVVQRLGGWPLALELAAAQYALLGLERILSTLDDGFAYQTPYRDVPARHRSLGDTIAWAVSLHDAAARSALRQLTAFRGRFRLTDVPAVVQLDGDVSALVQRLAQTGLVSGPDDEGYYLLLAPVRGWCRAELSADDGPAQRHASWAMSLSRAKTGDPALDGQPRLARWTHAETDLVAAWERTWADHDTQAIGDLSLALGTVAWNHGRTDIGLARMEKALHRCPDRPAIWHRAGMLADRLGHYDRGLELLETAAELAQGQETPDEMLAIYLQHVGMAASRVEAFDRADDLFRAALELAVPGSRNEMAARGNWCVSLAIRGAPGAVEQGLRSLKVAEALPAEPTMPLVLHNLARAHLATGDDGRAQAALARARSLAQRGGDPIVPLLQVRTGEAFERTDPQAARRWLNRSLLSSKIAGETRVQAESHARLARLAQGAGEPALAATHAADARRLVGYLPREFRSLLMPPIGTGVNKGG